MSTHQVADRIDSLTDSVGSVIKNQNQHLAVICIWMTDGTTRRVKWTSFLSTTLKPCRIKGSHRRLCKDRLLLPDTQELLPLALALLLLPPTFSSLLPNGLRLVLGNQVQTIRQGIRLHASLRFDRLTIETSPPGCQ